MEKLTVTLIKNKIGDHDVVLKSQWKVQFGFSELLQFPESVIKYMDN